MFDYSIAGLFTTHSFGPDRHYTWGLEQSADFLQETDLRARREHWASISSSANDETAEAPISKMGGAVQAPEEGETANAQDVEESVVLVDEKQNKDPGKAKKGAKAGKR
jgi:hypothetical protein